MINIFSNRRSAHHSRNLTIQLMGGLGNQLFQFAFGLYLSEIGEYDVRYSDLLLRYSPNALHTNRILGIGGLMSKNEIKRLTPAQYSIIETANRFFGGYIATEEPIDSSFPIALGNRTRLLRGYFQQFRFADAVRPQILKRFFDSSDFSFDESSSVLQRICIHMRYGDYSSNEQTRKFHGLTNTQFYVDQAQKLSKEFGVSEIYIVSDEPNRAVQDFLKLTNRDLFNVSVSESQTEQGDLSEIAKSSLVVTSNSSFSWWGAWLASSIHKSTIVCPDPWYADKQMNNPYLIKPDWRIAQRNYS
jgi:hypothetical protein